LDWKRIKAEYIAGGTSYRKLCEKYGVSRTTLQRKAKDEKWLELRSQAEAKTETKIVEVTSTKEAKKAVDLFDIADLLADKVREIAETVSDPDSIKKLTSAIKDIRDIKGIKSDADMREQEARIEKLRRECGAKDDEDNYTGVVLLPPVSADIKPPAED
jgi:crotonobetainyl-CoA:carnitine CoA-transferase CaiB-like acyl-CoA transferase